MVIVMSTEVASGWGVSRLERNTRKYPGAMEISYLLIE